MKLFGKSPKFKKIHCVDEYSAFEKLQDFWLHVGLFIIMPASFTHIRFTFFIKGYFCRGSRRPLYLDDSNTYTLKTTILYTFLS